MLFFRYDGKDEACQYNRSKVAVRVTGGVEISQNETQMAQVLNQQWPFFTFAFQWLFKNGPISVGLNANAMQFYKGGVSHPWKFLCSSDGDELPKCSLVTFFQALIMEC